MFKELPFAAGHLHDAEVGLGTAPLTLASSTPTLGAPAHGVKGSWWDYG